MKHITVKWEVNITSGTEDISLDQLECETVEEWESLDKFEQDERIQDALNELPERVNIILDGWK